MRSRATLFHLLRLAFGTSDEISVLSAIPEEDWREVFNLALTQGVAAIAMDGLQKLYDSNPAFELDMDKPECGCIKYEWISSTFHTEEKYNRTMKAADALAEVFPLVVLKGLAIARKYPIPSHRTSVDLDVFGRKDVSKQNMHDMTIGSIIHNDYKHTGFLFQGVMVEYHEYLSAWKSLRNGRFIEKTLQDALGNPDGVYANDYFNALFLAVHSYTHFVLEGGISLRHICDWWLTGIRILSKSEQQRLLETTAQFGMKNFVDSITRVAEYVCSNPSIELTSVDRKMLDDILLPRHKRRFRNGHLNMLYELVFNNGWKFKYYTSEGILSYLMRCGWNAIIG